MTRHMLTFVAVVLACAQLMSCTDGGSSGKPRYVGGPHYFGGFEGVKHRPELPTKPLTAEEVNVRKGEHATFFVAFFRDDGQVQSIEATNGAQVEWRSTYEYGADGKVRAGVTVHPSGRKEYLFDATGRQTSEIWYDSAGKEVKRFAF